jgi:hypothetical protein
MKPKQLRKKWLEFRDDLRVADIILVHDRKHWMGRLIRKHTGSYWNHSMIVLETWDHLSFGGPLIVDITLDDVTVHRLKRYTDHPERYDLGVLRLRGEMTERERKQVINFIFSNIDTPYDVARLFGYLFIKPLARRVLNEDMFQKAVRLFIDPRKFVCSSFVYRMFHRFRDMTEEHHEDDPEYQQLTKIEMQTPGDIAKDPLFEWKFNKHR